MDPLTYDRAPDGLVDALPELRLPVQRVLADWSAEPEGPANYIVYADTFACGLKVLMQADERVAGRDATLERWFAFGDALLGSNDHGLFELGIDAIAETCQLHPSGDAFVSRLGGPHLREWWAVHGATVGVADDEIIDLWGTRDALREGPLAGCALNDLPGISRPQDHQRLASLEAAHADPDGAVVLATFGTSVPLALAPARNVAASHSTLDAVAVELASARGGDASRGAPAAHFFTIPIGERVWQHNGPAGKHLPMPADTWIADDLPGDARARAIKRLAG